MDSTLDHEELRCEEVGILADRYVDQELPAEARRGVWRHIRDCVDCEVLLKGKAALKRLIQGSVRSVLAPSSLRQHLRAFIRA